MPTAKKGYFTQSGEKVPGVTTIIGRWKDSGALIWWAWDLGMRGLDYREVRDNAANAGTMAHSLVEQWAAGNSSPAVEGDPETVKRAMSAYGAFLEWAGQTSLQIVQSEVPLVSEKYRFGGTLDAMLVNGKLSLGDWKSSNAIYADYLMQLAAYGILWEENNPDRPITGGYHIIRFDKTHGDFEHRWFGDLEIAKRQFLRLREAYDDDRLLKARVR